MCPGGSDGGPLTTRGRRNLRRMLAMMAWHPASFCLVAVSPPSRVVGNVCGHLSYGDGLLPGAVGELHEPYVEPEHAGVDDLRRMLVEAAIARLRADDAGRTIRSTFDVHDTRHRELLAGLGFEADMITMSRYDVEEPRSQ